jgi:DNA polymerase I
MVDPITLDFETDGIIGNPIVNPPDAKGVAIWVPGHSPTYLHWGHPQFEVGDPRYPAGSKHNCTFGAAHEYLARIRDSNSDVLFHNAGFDISVLNDTFCNARWSWLDSGWRRVHDTMYLLFLADPYSTTLSLKPSAERYLGKAPTEQEELYDWIMKYTACPNRKEAGGWIAHAPGDLVAKYAIGDVVRTRELFDLLHKKIIDDGMEEAYDRERRNFPTLLHATRRGIRIDRDALDYHTDVYTECLDIASESLANRLGCPIGHLDEQDLLCDALERSGAVTEWVLTPTGKRSKAKDNLKIAIPDVKVLMDYRGALKTCLSTFMRPWLELSATDGRLHPNWNQVKQPKGDYGKQKGTRTGRLSSDSPNFQNVPTQFEDAFGKPLAVPDGLHPLPFMRRYCLPEPGHVWLKRDFSSQEIRILAHFEDGALAEAYRLNPNLDPHTMAQELIASIVGLTYARPEVKITGFSIIYGTGATGLSGQLGRSIGEAAQIKSAYLTAMPGVKELQDDVKSRGKHGQPIRTWGGRIYYAEAPKLIDGRYRDFAYKLLNYLVQGSAADQTKESISEWETSRKWYDIFLATVHDELNISAPKEHAKESMAVLKEAMNKDRLDVPMLSEGFMGENWHDLEEYEDEA